MKKRILAAVLTSILTSATVTSCLSYFNDQPMQPAPVQEGNVLVDLQVHLDNKKPLEELVDVLGSPGAVGLAYKENHGILTYEQAVDRIKDSPYAAQLREITPGQLAQFRNGYLLRTEEVTGQYHVQTIGWDGPYFGYQRRLADVLKVIDTVHDQGGIVVLNHPFTRVNGLSFREPTKQDRDVIRDLCTRVDLIETFNAHNINPKPFWMRFDWYMFKDMNQANRQAEELAATQCYGTNGRRQLHPIASSDAHGVPSQAKIAGVYLPVSAVQGMDAFQDALLDGPHEQYQSYVSRYGFVQGIGLDHIFKKIARNTRL